MRVPSRGSAELHLLEHRPAEQAVGTGEGLEDLEMVVALGDEQLRGLARGFHRGGEIARLALELGRLERAVGQHHRRVEAVEVALRAYRVLHGVGELYVAAARGQANRLHVEHAAAAQPALYGVGGQAEVL